jgi:tetratricopeptide (TPR) repeat protein
MSDCIDKNIGRMLHDFELGLLSKEDRYRFEMHLYDCDYCLDQVREFMDVSRILSEDPDALELIEKVAAESVKKDKKLFTPFLKILAAAAVLLLILILSPWDIEIKPKKQAVADENLLAVMYFENLTDNKEDPYTGEIISNLLITDLSQSEYINVVSSQRLYDILKQLGREGEKEISKDVATLVAQKSKARWMLTGNIFGREPDLILSSELVDVASGRILKSQKVKQKTGESIFDLIDELSVKIKKDLSLPKVAKEENDFDICDITTCSAEAYGDYIRGIEEYNKLYLDKAERYFQAAINFDPEFAMAYYELAKLESTRDYMGLSKEETGKSAKALIGLAVKYSEKTTAKEKLYIYSYSDRLNGRPLDAIDKLRSIILTYPDEKDAYYALAQIYKWSVGNPDSAIYYFRKVIEIDPYNKNSYNQLAYTYNQIGEYEKSIWAIGNYISLVPNETNPLLTKADIQLSNGKLSEARATLNSVLRIDPENYQAKFKLGYVSAFMHDYKSARQYFVHLSSSEDKVHRSISRLYLSLLYTFQGKYGGALELIDSLVEEDKKEGIDDFYYVEMYLLKSNLLIELGRRESAESNLGEIEILLNTINFETRARKKIYDLIFIDLELNDLPKARAANEKLKESILAFDKKYLFHYWFSTALIEFYDGDYKEASLLLEKVRNDGIYWETYIYYPVQYYLARSYLAMGDFDKSIETFEKIVLGYSESRYFFNTLSTTSHLYLGQAYEENKRYSEAIIQYKAFLDLWKDADQFLKQKYGFQEIRDRINRLETTL